MELLKRPEQRHVAYMEISETLNLGNTSAAHRFSLKVMPTVLQTHSSPALDEYIVLWGQMCDGSTLKRGYPNLKQQLQSLRVAGQTLPQPIQNILISFENNVANQ